MPDSAPEAPVRRSRFARWVAHDPLRAASTVAILAAVVWRLDIASRGFLAADDFFLTGTVADSRLTVDLLVNHYLNHLMPAPLLITWLITRAFGVVYWPYLLLLTVGQTLVGLTFYRLLRQLCPPGWGLLIPLAVLLFCPLTLENSSWWWSGANVLPMQLAMILAVGAQTKYVRTRRRRHLVSLGAAFLLGLPFYEKALLVAPLVFATTACLFVTGGVFRSIGQTLRRYWPSWLVLGVLSVAYLGLYAYRSESVLHGPASAGDAITFLRQLVVMTLVPGLFGGPWSWLGAAGDGAPFAATKAVGAWLACVAFIVVVVASIAFRPRAVRAWTLLAVYTALVSILIGLTRLSFGFLGAAGLVPRYVSDVVVVAAMCLAVALFGVRGMEEQAEARMWRRPALMNEPGVVTATFVIATSAIVAVAVGTASTASKFSDDWAVNAARNYVHTVEAELAEAPAGTVFFDRPVPDKVLYRLFWPVNHQSKFLAAMDLRPTFVEEAENPSVFDDAGRIRPMKVGGVGTVPGPDSDCGYLVAEGRARSMPLSTPVFEWPWVARVGYLSSGDAPAVVRLGDGERRFTVHRGLHEIFFAIHGGGNAVELTVEDPTVTLCVDQIMIGNPLPK